MEIVVKTEDGSYVPLPEDRVVLSKDELESAYVPADKVKDGFIPKADFSRRSSSLVEKALAEAHENDEVIARVLEKHTPPGADIDAAKEKWEQGRLKPLERKYESLRTGLRNAEVASRVGDVFDERYTRPLPGGKPSAMQLALNDQFAYNDEYGYVAAVDSAGNFIPSSDPSSAKPFRDVGEHLQSLAANPEWEPFLKQPPKGAGGPGPHGKPAETKKAFDPETATEQDKAAFIREHGVQAWMKLIS